MLRLHPNGEVGRFLQVLSLIRFQTKNFPAPNTGNFQKKCKVSPQDLANGLAYWLTDPLRRNPNTPFSELLAAFQWNSIAEMQEHIFLVDKSYDKCPLSPKLYIVFIDRPEQVCTVTLKMDIYA